ncbi:hypothetical protein CTI12_AA457040 [Artemisia annua]|uniref:AB hydrolase-1 domain-containing protein n=1 Tax=Artemisia annua TaxID=35608 RepID=A0A2U1LT91_ARTAN|nr:hypothetical protein CTI12_AA457040 [Artemisia annua]
MSSTIATTSHKAKKPRLNIKPSKELILINLLLDDEEEPHTPLSNNSTSSISTPYAPSKTNSTRATSTSSSTFRITPLSLPYSPLQPLTLSFTTPLELGYGESDPDPNRTLKRSTLDIEELSDQLGLGSKFYVVGFSMGGQVIGTCLKYIPHRLAGAALLAPAVNYWWPNLPANVSKEAYSKQFLHDQWFLRVAHYLPRLTYWWNKQNFFPSSSVISHSPAILSRQDIELVPKFTVGTKAIKVLYILTILMKSIVDIITFKTFIVLLILNLCMV